METFLRTEMAMYAAEVVGTSEFFWRVMERKLGEIPDHFVKYLDATEASTFTFWKGFCYMMENQGSAFSLSKHFEEEIYRNRDVPSIDLQYSSRSGKSNVLLLNAVAAMSKSIDPEKEAHEEYQRKMFMPL